MNWKLYRFCVESIALEDGGGFRAYYPTLGYGLVGHGEAAYEAVFKLVTGHQAYEESLAEFGLECPQPSPEDLVWSSQLPCVGSAATNNYAFAG